MGIWEDMNAVRVANAQKQNSGGNDKAAQAAPATKGADNTWAQYTQPRAASSNFGQAVASAVAPAYQSAPIYQDLGTVVLPNPEPEKKEEPEKEEKKDNKNEKEKGFSHKYDELRDWGGVVPIAGPILSMAGGLGNVLNSDFNAPINATSNAMDAVMNRDFLADPNAIAMPSVEDMRTSFNNDEDFNQYLRNTSVPLDSFLAESLIPGIGSIAGSAASKTAKNAAKESKDLATAAIEDAVKKGDEAAEKISSKAKRAKPNKVADAESKEFVDSYIDALPKDIQDYVRGSMPYGTRLGKMAGAKEAEQVLPVANALQDAAENKQLIGEFAGNTVPRLLRPLAMQTQTETFDTVSPKDSKNLDDSGGVAKEFKTYSKGLEDEESQEPGKAPIDPEALIYGLNRADYMNSSQRDQFLAAMRDEAMRDYYENKYGADITNQDIGYEWFRDLGDSLDYQESKHDLVRDLFGYADEEGNVHGIEDWQNLARGSGIDLSGDDEQDIQNILEYMWGKENIIDPALYFNDENYSKERNLSETGTSSRAMADYLLTQYGGIDPEALSAITGGLDMGDISAMVAAGDIMNNAGLRFGDYDLQDISDMLGFGGDKARFNYTDDEEDAFNWQADEGRSYNAANVYNSIKNAIDAYNEAMANNGTLPDGKNVADLAPLYDIYDQEGVDSPINAHLADDLMAAISGKSGKLIARS